MSEKPTESGIVKGIEMFERHWIQIFRWLSPVSVTVSMSNPSCFSGGLSALASFLLFSLSLAASSGAFGQDVQEEQKPYEYEVLESSMQERFYDAEYEEANRKLDETLEWIRNPANKKVLFAMNWNWSLLEAFNHVWGVRIAKGLGQPTAYHMKAARRTVERLRRGLQNNNKQMQVICTWLAEAELLFLEGDEERPPIYNMRFGANGELDLPYLSVAGKANSGVFEQQLGKFNWKMARKYYVETQNILQNQLALAFNQMKNSDEPPWADAHSLQLRLYIAQGHLAMLDENINRKARLRDAQAWYQRAQVLHNNNGRWNRIKAGNSDFPISYELFRERSVAKNAQEQKNGGGQGGGGQGGGSSQGGYGGSGGGQQRNAAGGGGEAGATGGEGGQGDAFEKAMADDSDENAVELTPFERLEYKTLWNAAMFDWFLLKLLRGEIEANDAEVQQGGLAVVPAVFADPAERTFKQIGYVTHSQFRNLMHPMPAVASHSAGTWMARRVLERNLAAVNGQEEVAFVSLCRDAVFYLRRARASGRLVGSQLVDNYASELYVLEVLVSLENASPFMTAKQKEELRTAVLDCHQGVDQAARELN